MQTDDVAKIRVRYSILVNYFSRIVRFLATMVSSVIIVRSFSVDEYGLLGLMLSTYNILVYAYSMWDWWGYRYYARKMYRYTAASMFLNIVYSAISVPLYIAIGYYYSSLLGFGFNAFLLMSVTVALAALQVYLQYISRASRPFIMGYAISVSEPIRASLVYILVYLYAYGLTGVVYSLIVSRLAAIIVYFYFLYYREKLYIPGPRFYLKEIKTILQNIYVQFVAYIANLVLQSERHIVTILSKAADYSAYFTISYLPRNIILGNTFAFTTSLTARLLRGKSKVDVEDTLRFAIIINTLQVSILLTYATPIIMILNPEYIRALPLLALYSLESYFASINNIFFSILIGTDKSDITNKGIDLIRSNIFLVIFLNLIRNITSISIGTTWYLYASISGINDPVYRLIMYPAGWLITIIVLMIYSYNRAKHIIKFTIPWREILSSCSAGIAIYSYAIITGSNIIYIQEFWPSILTLIKHVAIATIIYLLILLSLSKWTRKVIKIIIRKRK